MTRTRGQTQPPGGDIPCECGDHCAEDCRHRDNVGVHQSFADRGRNRAAKQRAGEVEERSHRNGFARRQDSG